MGHSADESAVREICTGYATDVCAEVKFLAEPNKTDEGSFVLKVQGPADVEVQDVQVDLWMQMGQHGHGSAPLRLTKLDDSTYKVENAWFVMKGQWLVRVSFRLDQTEYQLKLPVQIKD